MCNSDDVPQWHEEIADSLDYLDDDLVDEIMEKIGSIIMNHLGDSYNMGFSDGRSLERQKPDDKEGD